MSRQDRRIARGREADAVAAELIRSARQAALDRAGDDRGLDTETSVWLNRTTNPERGSHTTSPRSTA